MTRPRLIQAEPELAVPWPGRLAQLATELGRCGVEARVLWAGPSLPYLEVRQPSTVHTEEVYSDYGQYIWSWGEYIGREATAAAAAIAGLLGGGPGA